MTDSRIPAVLEQAAAHAASHRRRVSVADVVGVAVSSAQLAGGWLAVARDGDPDAALVLLTRDPRP